ncbi:MAG TPA: hypothetical protein VLT59_15045 [Steroidobacteraceae bacterium]|nr:hypothetical protein [Steroidobacteraceae bacterium]
MAKSPPRRRTKATAQPVARRAPRKRSAPKTPAAPEAPHARTETRDLPRASRGKRAQFHADPAVDALLAVIAALTAEVSVAFDRITTLERLLAERDVLAPDAVESYQPDETEHRRRNEARDGLIERVFRVLTLAGEGAQGRRSD